MTTGSYVKNSGIIGLSNLVYAILTEDDATAITYSTPNKIGEAVSVKVTPKVTSLTVYGDDGVTEQSSNLESIDVEIETTAMPLSVQAALLGHTISNGVMYRSSSDVAPYVAIGYKRKKLNGKYRYVWMYKGIFQAVGEEGQTLDDKPAVKTNTIKGTFVPRLHDNKIDVSADEEETGFLETTASGWFTAVQA